MFKKKKHTLLRIKKRDNEKERGKRAAKKHLFVVTIHFYFILGKQILHIIIIYLR